MKTILVTGGAGFIGSNFIRYLLGPGGFKGRVVNLDKLTYAGNLENLLDIERAYKGRYNFVKGDICDFKLLARLFKKYKFDGVAHFAAESHVDRSIFGPKDFIETNIHGTFALLETARQAWAGRKDARFHHISTDEVYGSLGRTGKFKETTPYDPRSPYSASKAGGDLLCLAYHNSFGLPVTITRGANNIGPYQYPEKVVPLFATNAIDNQPLPVYGDGLQMRDYQYVLDHCEGIDFVLHRGQLGEVYNVGTGSEMVNIDMAHLIRRQRNTVAHAEAYEKTYQARSVLCLFAIALLWPELPE